MLITIKTYRETTDAHLDKSYLESKGIKCYLHNENTVAADWLLSQAVGGVQLQVHKDNVETATKLLKEEHS